MKVFIICPVRSLNDKEKSFIEQYIQTLEEQGNEVHYPPRNTNQDDYIGYNICLQNCLAILEADEVHVYFNKDSKGTLFDLGMAFMACKIVKLINKLEPTEHKSFENVLIALDSFRKNKW